MIKHIKYVTYLKRIHTYLLREYWDERVKEITLKDTSLALTTFCHVKNLSTPGAGSPQLIILGKVTPMPKALTYKYGDQTNNLMCLR